MQDAASKSLLTAFPYSSLTVGDGVGRSPSAAHRMIGSGVMTATVEFFDRTMMEAMALLAETRRYLIDRSEGERKGMSVESGLAASMESMRLVARLTQVLAWLLTHRAVHAGEMTLVEATRDDRRLGGRELCMNTQGDDNPGLPEELRNLLSRSHALYRRIARLDELAANRAADQIRQTELTYPGKGFSIAPKIEK